MSGALAVILERQVVGRVERTRAGTLRLTYTDAARELGRTPLSLSLPTDSRSMAGNRVETFLRALLPDNSDSLRAVARRSGADAADVLAMLAAIGKDCAGAVQFCVPQDVEATLNRVGELVPATDADLEQRLAELRTSEDASWTMRDEHWSLGGTQNKFALRRDAGRWFEARGARATSHIFKPGIYQLATQALVEHVTMRAAAACGIVVAHTEYLEFKTESAIVVTRFDRDEDGDDLTRIHQEDMCQALGVAQKYEEYGGPSAASILDLLRQGPSDRQEVLTNTRRFVDSIVFNTVVAAPDAHARNYAVLLSGDRVRLAPLYDVATGLAYETTGNRVLSMSVGGSYRLDEIGRDEWSRFADENQLAPEGVIARAQEMAEIIPGAMRAALDEIDGRTEDVRDLRDRLLPRVDAHMLRVSARL